MDAKYLAEIKARCELGRPAQEREVKALLAEVERLTWVENEYRHYRRLSEKLDQQISTLKRTLEIANITIQKLSGESYEYSTSSFQALEQEGHDD